MNTAIWTCQKCGTEFPSKRKRDIHEEDCKVKGSITAEEWSEFGREMDLDDD